MKKLFSTPVTIFAAGPAFLSHEHPNKLRMVKTSTQKNSVSASSNTSNNDLKPSRAVISFLVNYSKALEIKNTKQGEPLSLFKN